MFCSLFEMENYQAGDLTDVIRASSAAAAGGGGGYSYGGAVSSDFSLDPIAGDSLWPHLPADNSVNFGDPLLFPTTTRDPFLHHPTSTFNFASDGGGGGGSLAAVAERPCNIFSRMLQISPSSKVDGGVINTTRETAAAASAGNSAEASACGGGAASSTAVVSNPLEDSGLQISPPRNPAIKRRKNQVKKVVCIPAPAPANSRSSSGEVVPSDLWAWRKYGQKPIKGSPYPRGYYRCSSSKGCSARKQVERSRTDPNMLVITYTSEHNHPWPTQRNALAGSTRSHPSRNPAPAHKTSSKLHEHNNDNLASPLTQAVKGEEVEEDQTTEKAVATTTDDHQDREGDDHQEFPYDLIFAEFADQMNGHDNHRRRHDHPHDQADPLNNVLLFSSHGSKDPFLELYDWAESNNNNNQLIGNYSSNANNLF